MFKKVQDAANTIVQLGDKLEKETLRRKKLFLLNAILLELDSIENTFETKKTATVSSAEKHRLLKELKIDPAHLEEALETKEMQTVYKGNVYGRISNIFFDPLTKRVMHLFPGFANTMHNTLMSSGMRILSNTYISMLLFTSFLLLFVGSAIGVMLFYTTSIFDGFFLGFLLASLSVVAFILYPRHATKERQRELNKEYPFIVTHVAAIASTNVHGLGIFKTLAKTKHYKALSLDVARVINYVVIFGYSIPDALKLTATSIPSKNVRDFFLELAQRMDAKEDVKSFLNRKARMLIAQHQLKKAKKLMHFANAYRETATVMKQLHFKISYALSFVFTITILVLDILYMTGTVFYLLLFLAILVGWSPFLYDTYKTFEKNRRLEVEFFHFVRDMRKAQSMLRIKKTYGTLEPHVEKLVNQYKIGIPLEQALETFARDTENYMIEGTVAVALESKKHGANLYEALDTIATSKMTRHILRFRK